MSAYKTIEAPSKGEIEIKKSRFIAQLAPVETEDQALAFLEEVRAANRMARHNVYAYVLRDGGWGPAGRTRYSDDGEPQKTAGMPTLEVIQRAELTDIICVTTRYFGGVLLGTGGLVRAYTQAAQEALAAARVVAVSRCVDICVTIDYPRYDQLVRMASEGGAHIQDTAFTDTVTVTLRMLDGTQGPLLDKISELTRGSARVSVSDPFDASF